jgi:acyl-CoA thioesterase-2
VDATSWLGLEPSHNPHRWHLPVSRGISTGHRAMFGGSGLGAAIAAMEGTSGRPVVWATAQYLSFAKVGTIVDIDVTLAVQGQKTTQARAVGHVGGTEIITVNAALGSRTFPRDTTYGTPPDVEHPEECPIRERFSEVVDSLDSRIEQRWALPLGAKNPGELEPGRIAVWSRMPELLEPSGASFAVLGDYVPMGISFTQDGQAGSTSLDNTLRVIQAAPSEWYLLDIRVDAISNGFGHGVIHIWSLEGELCAIGSQSCIVRSREPGEHTPPKRLAEAPDQSLPVPEIQ